MKRCRKVRMSKIVTLMAMLTMFRAGTVRAGDNVWTSLGPQGGSVTVLAIDPQNSGTVYAATGAGLFKSADDGASWNAVSPGPPCCILTLVIDPQSTSTIYAVAQLTGLSPDRSVIKSTDGGATWSPANSGLPVDADGHYGITSLAIDPQSTMTIYAGNSLTGGGGIFKSTDGGSTWNTASSGLPDGGVMDLAVDPQNEGTLYVSNRASGVFQSTDGGASWNAVNSGLCLANYRMEPVHGEFVNHAATGV
jgi:photosystem II stability/assembly factor-like uncharacterized protein